MPTNGRWRASSSSNDDPDVKRIQTLSERLVTTSELHQFLESVLAATVETLRTPTAFVAAITNEGPRLEAVVGPLAAPETILQDADIRQIAQGNGRQSGGTMICRSSMILFSGRITGSRPYTASIRKICWASSACARALPRRIYRRRNRRCSSG